MTAFDVILLVLSMFFLPIYMTIIEMIAVCPNCEGRGFVDDKEKEEKYAILMSRLKLGYEPNISFSRPCKFCDMTGSLMEDLFTVRELKNERP